MSVAQIKAVIGDLTEEEREELTRFLDAENHLYLRSDLPFLEEIDKQEQQIPEQLAVRHDSEEGWLASFQAAIHRSIADNNRDTPVDLPTNLSTTWKRVKAHRLIIHHDL